MADNKLDKFKGQNKFNGVKTTKWFKNAAKSLGYSVYSAFSDSEVAPATMNTIKNTFDFVKEMKELKAESDGSDKSISKFINSKTSPIKKTVGDVKGNIIKDLKSGTLNNKQRADAAMMNAFGGDDFDMGDFGDFDDFGDDDDFSFSDDYDDSDFDTDDGDINFSQVNIETDDESAEYMVSAINAQSNIMVQTAKRSSEQNIALSKISMQAQQEMNNKIYEGLNVINSNISNIIEFNNSKFDGYVGASLKFYEEATKVFTKITDYIDSIYKKKEESNYWSYDDDDVDVMENDGFSLSNYKKIIKKNIRNTMENDMLLSMFSMAKDMGGMGLFEEIKANPLGFVMDTAAKKLMPKFLKETVSSFDKTIKEFIPAVLGKLGDMGDTMGMDAKDIFLSYVGQIFGIKKDMKYRPWLSGYEKGPVPFDGVTRKSIVEVIPTYLSKIYSALSGKDEMFFNYEQGIFQTAKDILEEYDRSERYASIGAYDTYNLKSKARNAYQFDNKTMERFEESLDNFLDRYTKTDSEFNPRANKGENGDLITSYFTDNEGNADPLLQELFRELLKSQSDSELLKMRNQKEEGRRNLTDKHKRDEKNPDIYTTLKYNRSMGQNFQLDYNNQFINAKDYYNGEKKYRGRNSIFTPLDKYGKSSLDYLRSINRILLEAVPVYDIGVRDKSIFSDRLKRFDSDIDKTVQTEEYRKANPESTYIIGKNPDGTERVIRRADMITTDSSGNPVWDTNTIAEIVGTAKSRLAGTQYTGYEQGNRKTGFIERLLSKSDAGNKILDAFKPIFTKVEDKISEFNTTIDSFMYRMVFGDNKEDKNARGSFIERVADRIKQPVDKFFDYVKDKLFNENDGFFTKLEKSEWFNKVTNKIKKWGEKSGTVDDIKSTAGDIFGKVKDSVVSGLENFNGLIFGNIKDSVTGESVARESVKSIINKIKTRAPKSIIGGIAGASLAALSPVGLLGQLFLGPMSGLTVGAGTGFLSQSERFKEFIFGKLDRDTNERAGAVFSKLTQKFFKDNKSTIKKGGIAGGVAGLAVPSLLASVPGLGLMSSLVIGGPAGGALLGIGGALISRSETFQDFLFGVKDKLGLAKDKLKEANDKNKLSFDKKLGTIGVGTLGGIGLGSALSSFGALGSLAFGPIGGALVGAATGITISSKKWRDKMFGKDDGKGESDGTGLLDKLSAKITEKVILPSKVNGAEIKESMKDWFQQYIAEPILDATYPIKEEMKRSKERIGFIVDAISEKIGLTKFFKDAKEKLFDKENGLVPKIAKGVGSVFKGLGKGIISSVSSIVGNAISGPIKLIDKILTGKHQREGIKTLRQILRENLRNTRFIKAIRNIPNVLMTRISDFFEKAQAGISTVWDFTKQLSRELFDKIDERLRIREKLNTAKKAVSTVTGAVKGFADRKITGIKDSWGRHKDRKVIKGRDRINNFISGDNRGFFKTAGSILQTYNPWSATRAYAKQMKGLTDEQLRSRIESEYEDDYYKLPWDKINKDVKLFQKRNPALTDEQARKLVIPNYNSKFEDDFNRLRMENHDLSDEEIQDRLFEEHKKKRNEEIDARVDALRHKFPGGVNYTSERDKDRSERAEKRAKEKQAYDDYITKLKSATSLDEVNKIKDEYAKAIGDEKRTKREEKKIAKAKAKADAEIMTEQITGGLTEGGNSLTTALVDPSKLPMVNAALTNAKTPEEKQAIMQKLGGDIDTYYKSKYKKEWKNMGRIDQDKFKSEQAANIATVDTRNYVKELLDLFKDKFNRKKSNKNDENVETVDENGNKINTESTDAFDTDDPDEAVVDSRNILQNIFDLLKGKIKPESGHQQQQYKKYDYGEPIDAEFTEVTENHITPEAPDIKKLLTSGNSEEKQQVIEQKTFGETAAEQEAESEENKKKGLLRTIFGKIGNKITHSGGIDYSKNDGLKLFNSYGVDTAGFGKYNDSDKNHFGVDKASVPGNKVPAFMPGNVLETENRYASNSGKGFGNYVKVQDDAGGTDIYGHLDGVNVNPGDRINTGDIIGKEGNTGNSDGNHLHFETWKDNNIVDPYSYLSALGGKTHTGGVDYDDDNESDNDDSDNKDYSSSGEGKQHRKMFGTFGKTAAEQKKEQEEKSFMDKILGSINKIKEVNEKTKEKVSDFTFNWKGIFSKKGLITAALLIATPLIIKGINWVKNNWKGSLTGIVKDAITQSITSLSTSGPAETFKNLYNDEDETRTDASGDSDSTRSVVEDGGKFGLQFGLKTYLTSMVERFGAKDAAKAVEKSTDAILDFADYAATTGFTREATESGIGGIVRNTANATEDTGLLSKFISKIADGDNVVSKFINSASGRKSYTKAYSKAFDSGVKQETSGLVDDVLKISGNNTTKLRTRFITTVKKAINSMITYIKSKISGYIKSKMPSMVSKGVDDVFKSIKEFVNGNKIKQKFVEYSDDIARAFSKATGTSIADVALFIGRYFDLTVATGYGLLGATTEETAKLFEVPQDKVDDKMAVISGIIKGLLNYHYMVLVDILFDMMQSATGIDVLHNLATGLYKLLSDDEADIKLSDAQLDFDKNYDEYTKIQQIAKGNATINSDGSITYKDKSLIESEDSYNDRINKNIFSRAWDSIKSGASSVKTFFTGRSGNEDEYNAIEEKKKALYAAAESGIIDSNSAEFKLTLESLDKEQKTTTSKWGLFNWKPKGKFTTSTAATDEFATYKDNEYMTKLSNGEITDSKSASEISSLDYSTAWAGLSELQSKIMPSNLTSDKLRKKIKSWMTFDPNDLNSDDYFKLPDDIDTSTTEGAAEAQAFYNIRNLMLPYLLNIYGMDQFTTNIPNYVSGNTTSTSSAESGEETKSGNWFSRMWGKIKNWFTGGTGGGIGGGEIPAIGGSINPLDPKAVSTMNNLQSMHESNYKNDTASSTLAKATTPKKSGYKLLEEQFLPHISQNFGKTSYNPDHKGMDFTPGLNYPIPAFTEGEVVRADSKYEANSGGSKNRDNNGWGNLVVVKDPSGGHTYYAHLNGVNVKKGDKVNIGDTIGLLGHTGWSTGAHLHLETRTGEDRDTAISPIDYLNGRKETTVDSTVSSNTTNTTNTAGTTDDSSDDYTINENDGWFVKLSKSIGSVTSKLTSPITNLMSGLSSKFSEMLGFSSASDSESDSDISDTQTTTGNAAITSGNKIGDAVKQFESGSSGSRTIANNSGDAGGKSFGTYQFASFGTKYMNEKDNGSNGLYRFWKRYYAKDYPNVTPGDNPDFEKAWLDAVDKNPEQFAANEWEEIARNYYRPMVTNNANVISPDTHSRAAQDLLWSTAVQYGPNTSVIRKSLEGSDPSKMTAKELINKISDYKANTVSTYFSGASSDIRKSVKNRFDTKERNVLLSLGEASPIKYTVDGTKYPSSAVGGGYDNLGIGGGDDESTSYSSVDRFKTASSSNSDTAITKILNTIKSTSTTTTANNTDTSEYNSNLIKIITKIYDAISEVVDNTKSTSDNIKNLQPSENTTVVPVNANSRSSQNTMFDIADQRREATRQQSYRNAQLIASGVH